MSEYPMGPTVDITMIELVQERFGRTEEARDALRRAVAAISDEQLGRVRGIFAILDA